VVPPSNTGITSIAITEDKEVAKEYLEQTLPPQIKQEVSLSEERTQTSHEEDFIQTQTRAEKVTSFQQSSMQQEQVSGRHNFKTEQQSHGQITDPECTFKHVRSGLKNVGAFPFTDEDILKVQDASCETSHNISGSVQYSSICRQTEMNKEESGALYETKPIKSLIQTFEQNSRPPMKYKQIQKEGANIIMNVPAQHKREPILSQEPVVNGNVYYVASTHVETRQFGPQPAETATQNIRGYEISENQVGKFSSFLSSEQQRILNEGQEQSSRIQTFQSKSLHSSEVNQQQLLTQITGKIADFFISLLIFFSETYPFWPKILKVVWFLYAWLTFIVNK
jgi:hypothetical protein